MDTNQMFRVAAYNKEGLPFYNFSSLNYNWSITSPDCGEVLPIS